MLEIPTALLKKLKSSPKSKITDSDVRALARLAIDEGEEAFVECWRAANAKPVKPTAQKVARAPAKSKSDSQTTQKAAAKLKAFGDARGLRSDELARAFLSFAAEQETGLPRPPASASKGSPAAVRWLEAKTSDSQTLSLTELFVIKFRADTDYTYHPEAP